MQNKKLLIVFSFLIYSLLFFILFPIAGVRCTAFSLIPIIVTGYLAGVRASLLMALAIIPVSIFYLYIFGQATLAVLIENIPGAIGSFLISWLSGYVGNLQQKSHKQLEHLNKEKNERIKAEEELFHIQNLLQHNLYGEQNFQFEQGTLITQQISNNTYREIAENAADIIYITDINGNFIYINKAATKLSGYSTEELQNLRSNHLVLPACNYLVKRFYLTQLKEKKATAYLEVPIITKNGNQIWLAQNSTLVYNNEQIYGFSIIARNITEKKKFELELKEKEEMLQLITQSASDAIISTDRNYNIFQWNKAAEKIYGYTEKEIIGMPVTLLMADEDKKLCLINMEDCSKSFDFNKTFERIARRKDGSLFPVEMSITDWKRHEEIFRTHIIRDISERKEAEQKLKQSEKDYRLVFMSAHEPIIVFNPEDEVILEANDKACEVYGFDRSEFVGLSLKRISSDVKRGEQKISETLNAGSIINFQTVQFRKDGKKLFLEVNASTIEYKGKPAVLSINRDITEKLEVEKRIRLLLAAIDNTSEMITLHDIDSKIIFGNKTFLQTFGYTEEEVIGKTPSLVSKEKSIINTDRLMEVTSQSGHWSGTILAKKKNGEEFLISLNTSLVTEPKTDTMAVIAVSRDITNEIEANEKLKESEERYRVLFENNPLPVIVYDYENKSISGVNKAAIQSYGYSYQEFSSMNAGDLVIDSFPDVKTQNYPENEWDNTNRIYQVHRRKNGSSFYAEISTYILNISGRVSVINIINDISRRLKIEKEIIRQRDIAQKYMDISPVLMCVLDSAGNITLMNETGCKIIGYTEEEVAGKNWVRLCFIKDMWEGMDNILKEIMDGNNRSHEYFENTIITSSGEEKIIAFHNTAIIEEDSGVSGILFSGEDITERKKSEKVINDYQNHLEQLVSERTARLQQLNAQLFQEYRKLSEADEQIQNQNEFFKTLINTIPLPVFIKDNNKVFIECNSAFEKFFGVAKKDLLGKKSEEIFSRSLADLINNKDDLLFSGSIEQQFESNAIDKYGSIHEIIIYQSAINKKDGSVDGTLAVLLDITSQKILQRETTRSLEKERELNELKSGFISMASHEFRTPLTTILASADLLEILGPKWDEEKYKKHLIKIQNAVAYMTELIDDVLLINKAETGKMNFIPVNVNVINLVKETIDNFRVTAGENFNFNFKHDSKREKYVLDLKLITQIVTNLISNAVKYSPKGGDIDINLTETDSMLKLEFSDNGIGIGEEDLKHLFQPFHRGKNIENIPGTGLGLSIVQKAVEMHDGKIFVESTLGKGSEFTIFLPVIDNHE